MQMDDIRKLALKALLFLVLLILFSYIHSACLDKINEKENQGYYGFLNVIRERPEIVILGASRARDHYVTPMIAQATHRTAYNFGTFNSSVLVQYSQLVEILKLYRPQLIIYEVSGFDFAQGYMNSNIEHLKLFPENDMLERARREQDDYYILRRIFPLYKHNKTGLNSIQDFLTSRAKPKNHLNQNLGYHSLGEAHLPELIKQKQVSKQVPADFYNRNALLAEAFQVTLNIIKKERLNVVFMQSPYYEQKFIKYPPMNHGVIDQLVNKDLPYYDFHEIDAVAKLEAEYFYDLVHLTERGARLYTKNVIPIIIQHLDKNEIVSQN